MHGLGNDFILFDELDPLKFDFFRERYILYNIKMGSLFRAGAKKVTQGCEKGYEKSGLLFLKTS